MDDTASYIGHDSSVRSLILRTNSADRLTIKGDGNVGIGTTSPTAKLEIAGFSTGAGLKLNYGNSSGTIEAVNFIANGAANGVIGMQMVSAGVGDLWLGGSGGRILTLYRDGNVGIGTSSPVELLTVQGNININYNSADANYVRRTFATNHAVGNRGANLWFGMVDGGGMMGMQIVNAASSSSGYNSQFITFVTHEGGISVDERMRITSVGNVGIGTTSPSDKLDVNGAVYIRAGNSLKLDNTSNNYVAQINNGGSSGASTLVFQTGGSARMRIINNGNVGIGTATPSTELEVVGTITCTTLVETSNMSSKTNIKKLTSQTEKIAKLSPVSFNYKINNKCSLGLIAEEVAKVYPELVEYENDRALGVNYSKLTSVLISAVNELAAEVAELKKQLIK
jgi:hypothetical protein